MTPPHELEARVEALFARLLPEEKLALSAGVDMWHSAPLPRLGVRGIKVTDGPNGARGEDFRGGPGSACLPCGSALAATWDPELVAEVGAVLAEEARSKGAQVLLAPTVNIHRSPLAGRNFECFSEDPYLSARCAVAFVRGVQSRGVGSAIKHFVCNDSEFERHTISAEVDERTLREIYLAPFEAAVRDAQPWAVMAAYNALNGTPASEHEELLTGILKQEWGFQGFVVSDWFGARRGLEAARAGLDLEMPGPARQMGDKLAAALSDGALPQARVDDTARRLLRAMARAGVLDASSPEPAAELADDRPEHRAIARRAAARACVLLQNDGTLPLDATCGERLALIGPRAESPTLQGGGSAHVKPHYRVTPVEAISERSEGPLLVEPGCHAHRQLPVLGAAHCAPSALCPAASAQRPIQIEYFAGERLDGVADATDCVASADFTWLGPPAKGIDGAFSARVRTQLVSEVAGPARLALSSAGLSRLAVDGQACLDNWEQQTPGDGWFGAGSSDLECTLEFEAGVPRELCIEYRRGAESPLGGLRAGWLAPQPGDLLARAEQAAAHAEVALVFVGLDADWETEGRDRVDMRLPGRQDELVERVAAVNPRTVVVVNAGSPVEMDWLPRVAAVVQLWYPGQECGNALADVLFGEVDAAGRLPTSFPRRASDAPSAGDYPGREGRVHYREGIFVGYRGYEASGVEPLFPFGHGLSYTRFEYEDLRLSASRIGPGEALELQLRVANVGKRRGIETVQLYLHDLEASLPRPDQELRGFAKLELEPGESRHVSLRVEPRDLSFWDPNTHGWRAEPGDFEVRVGASSRDIRLRALFRLEA